MKNCRVIKKSIDRTQFFINADIECSGSFEEKNSKRKLLFQTLAQNFERIKVNDSESVYVGVHSLFDKNDWVSIAGDPVSETLNWKLMSNGTDATSEANKNCGVLSGETIDKVDCDDKHMAICLM